MHTFTALEEGSSVTSPNCSSGCSTGPHATWGECVRAKSLKIAYSGINGSDATAQKNWDGELDEYRSAVAQGIQPETTKIKDTREAIDWSQRHGQAYSYEKATEVLKDQVTERYN